VLWYCLLSFFVPLNWQGTLVRTMPEIPIKHSLWVDLLPLPHPAAVGVGIAGTGSCVVPLAQYSWNTATAPVA